MVSDPCDLKRKRCILNKDSKDGIEVEDFYDWNKPKVKVKLYLTNKHALCQGDVAKSILLFWEYCQERLYFYTFEYICITCSAIAEWLRYLDTTPEP